MYRRYYSYSDMPQLVKHEAKEETVCKEKAPQKCMPEKHQDSDKILGKFELDDIILGVVILALLLDDGDDTILLIALAVVFLTGFN